MEMKTATTKLYDYNSNISKAKIDEKSCMFTSEFLTWISNLDVRIIAFFVCVRG